MENAEKVRICVILKKCIDWNEKNDVPALFFQEEVVMACMIGPTPTAAAKKDRLR